MLNCLFNIFNFGNLGFIVNLGIVLLLTGIIMLYIRHKFSIYDNCLEEQSKMLRQLVVTLQNNNYSNKCEMSNNDNELASNIAISSARKINSKKSNKIIVSDDESETETESVSESESESETESESESETESESENDSSESGVSEYNSEIKYEKKENIENNKKLSNNDDDDNIPTITTKTNNLINDLTTMGGISVISSMQGMNMGGICYLELLSELNNNDKMCDNDLNQCIKVISINSTDENNNSENVIELDDILQDNNVLDKSFIVSKLKESLISENNDKPNLNENNDSDETIEKYNLEQLKDMKKTKLQELCKKKSVSTNGTRTELITRLSNLL